MIFFGNEKHNKMMCTLELSVSLTANQNMYMKNGGQISLFYSEVINSNEIFSFAIIGIVIHPRVYKNTNAKS